MLSQQAKRQGSFSVCAPCRRQLHQGLAQLRSRDRIRSITILSSLQHPSTNIRPVSKLLNLSTTTRQINNARGYAAWGKFGSNTVPGQSNSAWAAALKKKTPDTPTSASWGASLGKKTESAKDTTPAWAKPETPAWAKPLPPSSPPPVTETTTAKSKPEPQLPWEALNPSSKPSSIQTSPDSRHADSVKRSQNGAGLAAKTSLDDILSLDSFFGTKQSRAAPPGAEFPNLLRRESKANAFESTSPWTLPSGDRRSQNKLPDYGLGGSGSDTSRQGGSSKGRWQQRSTTTPLDADRNMGRAQRSPNGTMARDPDHPYQAREPAWSNEEDPFAALSEAARTQNDRRPYSAPARRDTGYSDMNQSLYRDHRDTGSRHYETGDWRNIEEGQNPSDNAREERSSFSRHIERENTGRDSNEDNQVAESRNNCRQAEDSSRDHDEGEYFIVRSGRKGKGRDNDKHKSNSNRRSSQRDFEDDYDGRDFDDYRDVRFDRKRAKEDRRATQVEEAPKTMVLPEYIAVIDLADALRIKPKQFLEDLETLGFENLLPDSVMTGETAALVAAEYGFEASLDTGDGVDLKPRPPPEDPSAVPPRPPVVTIMGHVDHGKTSILDWMRKSSIAAGEHGGITQHIGAFSVKLRSDKTITFLDTPGHAAFLTMRQRGAYVTDIVVLVVAVDDSVMPQTIEALKHAQNAKVPIIVAVNKIDLDPNRMDHVKQDLASHDVEIEDFGGDVQVVGVSARTGQGMDNLEETILTLSEILDLRAETDGLAEGWVLEASTKKEGRAATILVKRGTLRVGDLIVAGTTYTRIRIMRNEAGADIEEAPPGTAVEIFGGWSGPPVAGDMVLQAPDETRGQTAVKYRLELAQRAASAAQKAQQEQLNREKAEQAALEKEMEELGEEEGEEEEGKQVEPVETGPKIVNIIVRGDVMGSVEAVSNSIMEIGNNEVRPRILRSAPGAITESDVDLLATTTGMIVNFNNNIPGFVRRKAADAGIPILDHNIIYEVVTDVKKVLSKDLTPITHQRVAGEAEVLEVFAINVVKRIYKNIAGVKVRTGHITKNGLYRVMRDGEKIFDGKLDALKEGRKDVTEMKKGTECGVSLDGFEDFKPGDIIQLYEEVFEKRYL